MRLFGLLFGRRTTRDKSKTPETKDELVKRLVTLLLNEGQAELANIISQEPKDKIIIEAQDGKIIFRITPIEGRGKRITVQTDQECTKLLTS
ncbi:hypothetical protein COY23_04345 [bacterium (Candidatus Torokbacteria) CG_4_10_14_0_2_um_filter_35_8]|nr:MAG: hypothetical protein COY23_04345 [bacterium (Candidatus Torokbacteria) CG_4_10_14_0_2_um_filter_35_8]